MVVQAKGYNGNLSLKRKGTPIEFTADMVEEYIKCANDPIYFAEKYIQIVHVDHGLIPIKMYEYQKEITRAITNHRRVTVNTSRQAGKMQTLDTVIPTPDGFQTMGDIRVGDKVFGDDGYPVNVSFVSDRQVRPYYKITFDDGSSTTGADNHRWTVYSRFNREGHCAKDLHKPQVLTTEEILNSCWKHKNSHGYYEYAYYIPNCKPVQYTARDQLIDPYVLGCWLGDGSSWGNQRPNVHTARIEGLSLSDLRYYGLLEQSRDNGPTKHIPDDYHYGSVEQRLSLVQGLFDTDGFISADKRWSIQLTRKNQRLIDDIYTLLCSLGVKVTRLACPGTNSERLSFRCGSDLKICRIAHKADRAPATASRYSMSRTIQNIEYIGEREGVCIQVDNESHLYLCEHHYIPTHNTTTAVAVILHYVLFNDYKTVALLANKGDAAREILDRLKIAYEALPTWLQQGVEEWNKGSVEFENGCKIIAAATSSSAIRGKSCSFLYIDETAFVENWDEFFASVLPTVSSGKTTKMLFTSTPNGLNHFYKTCMGAKELEEGSEGPQGKNGFIYIEVPWQRVPGRDLEWKNETLASMDFDNQKFAQEFSCVTGDSLVTIRCKDTGEERTVEIQQLYNELYAYKHTNQTKCEWSKKRKGKCWTPRKISHKQAKEIYNSFTTDTIDFNSEFIRKCVKASQRDIIEDVDFCRLKLPNGKALTRKQLYVVYYAEMLNVTRANIRKILNSRGITAKDHNEV